MEKKNGGVIQDKSPKNKVFLSKAYLRQVERGTFGLFRDVEMETDESDEKGNRLREKVKAIGPIKLLREARPGEEKIVVLKTVHPETFKELSLVELPL